MNKVLIGNTIHRLLSRPMSLLLLAGYGLYVMVSVFAGTLVQGEDALRSATAAWFITWALGTGLLGTDRSEGYLPLLLSRPISRAQYVLSRWLGLVLCVLAVDLGLHLVVALFYATQHMGLNVGALLQRWAWFAYFVALTAAWVTLLSAVFNRNGDLFYFIAGSLALLFLASKFGGETVFNNVGAGLAWFWKPGEATLNQWNAMNRLGALYTALIFVAGAGVSLATAAYVMQRRDVSYVNR